MKCIFLNRECIKQGNECLYCELRYEAISNPEYYDGMRKCPRTNLSIYCMELHCSNNCDIYSRQTGYLAYAINEG